MKKYGCLNQTYLIYNNNIMQSSIVERDSDFYIYINSTDSLAKFPANNFYHFHIALPKAINLKQISNCYWTLQLIDVALLASDILLPIPENIFILTDIIESSIARGGFYPILKQIWASNSGKQGSLSSSIQVPLTSHIFDTFSIRVLTDKLEPLDLEEWEKLTQDWTALVLSCVLHFQLMEKIVQ